MDQAELYRAFASPLRGMIGDRDYVQIERSGLVMARSATHTISAKSKNGSCEQSNKINE